MNTQREHEIANHSNMKLLEIFLVDVTSERPHGHSDLEIGMVLSGRPLLYVDTDQIRLAPGDIYVINRYQVHAFRAEDQNLILMFRIKEDFFRNLSCVYESIRFEQTLITSGFPDRTLHRMLRECAGIYFGAGPYHEIQCLSEISRILYLLLTQIPCRASGEQASASAKNNAQRLERILNYLSEHHTGQVSLQDLAELEGVSVWHISHFITSMIGIPFQEYLNNLRFEHAMQLIYSTNLTIQDICISSGFSGSRYLNQMFQKHFGCSAREYRSLKQKPPLRNAALPTGNIRTRYPFEFSENLLEKYMEEL